MTIVTILNFAIIRPLHYYLHIFSHWYHPEKCFIIFSHSQILRQQLYYTILNFSLLVFGILILHFVFCLIASLYALLHLVKCFYIFIILFLSGDIQLNPGPISLNHYFSSPFDVYEPFSTPNAPKLRIATLNSRSVLNKSAIINNHILENKIDILCITET